MPEREPVRWRPHPNGREQFIRLSPTPLLAKACRAIVKGWQWGRALADQHPGLGVAIARELLRRDLSEPQRHRAMLLAGQPCSVCGEGPALRVVGVTGYCRRCVPDAEERRRALTRRRDTKAGQKAQRFADIERHHKIRDGLKELKRGQKGFK